MGDKIISVKRINDILQNTIYSIENSKEEIIDIVDQARENVKILEEELIQVNEKVNKVIEEVDELEIKEKKGKNILPMSTKTSICTHKRNYKRHII